MPLATIPVITIDGPTASGKGTVAHLVAVRLGFHYLDSGALYRLTALSAMRKHLDPANEHGLAKAAAALNCHFNGEHVFLSNEDVTAAIRAEAVGNFASCIATLPAVRQALYALQLGFRSPPGLVADGRDMGTVIFPRATLKIFLTASAEARAERRLRQLIGKGMSATLHDLQKDLNERDARDANRAIAPLKPAEDAHLLETSNMTAEDAVNQVLAWYAAARKREESRPVVK